MLTINASRLLKDIDDLARIGATPDGGVTRCAFSAADVAGRAWFADRVRQAQLTLRLDGAGNLSAVLPAADPAAPTLLLGSHLDTVPNGGRFDGALGVLAALEVLRSVQEAALALPVHLEAISFTDEEGSVLGLFGSQALSGQLTAAHLDHPRGGAAPLAEGMARLGITPESALAARRDPATLRGFLELHVEQGTRLEKAGLDIGIVSGIVGIRSAWLTFHGRAAHAGTTPLDQRADALLGAAAFVRRARRLVGDRYQPGVVNCGSITALPGAFNIVPEQVRLALEFRHGTAAQLDDMETALHDLARTTAVEHGLTVTVEPADNCRPAPADPAIVTAFEEAAEHRGLRHTRLLSFAGHDTQTMATITPSGMIFVPSVDGISHNPRELTHDQDLVNGANVLLQAALHLAQTP